MPDQHVRISKAAQQDISCWQTGLELFNGQMHFLCDISAPAVEFSTDACLVGVDGHFQSEWLYVNWA
jgi:hypothetical protein